MFMLLGHPIAKETDFMQKICACVWSEDLEPEEFEMEWNKIIVEFSLTSHTWLRNMYEIRTMWIPAYFRDLFLGGLMRTTSRSESENNFFNSFTNPHLNLVEFYMRYESSLDFQRHNQAKNDNDSAQMQPQCKTPTDIEKHASKVYTHTLFYVFQHELEVALYGCGLEGFYKENGGEVFMLKEGRRKKLFNVVFDETRENTTCSCKHYERVGIPCAHMIWVWNSKMLKKIPEQHVLPRWCRDVLSRKVLDKEGNILDVGSHIVERTHKLNYIWSEVQLCVSLAQQSDSHMDILLKSLQATRMTLEEKTDKDKGSTSKIRDIEMLLGQNIPKEIEILPPKVSKNKGTGVHTRTANKDNRLKSKRELAIEQNQKNKRMCRGCNELAFHDIRNCPFKA